MKQWPDNEDSDPETWCGKHLFIYINQKEQQSPVLSM